MSVYHNVLKACEINVITRESATGALQNITAGESRVSSTRLPLPLIKANEPRFVFELRLCAAQRAALLANWALEYEHIQPTLIELMRTERDMELRSLTGLLRNLSRHSENKDAIGQFSFLCILIIFIYKAKNLEFINILQVFFFFFNENTRVRCLSRGF